MQSINASVQCEIKKRGAYLRACWPYPVSPSSSTWSASPPDSASLQECCSPLRGNRVEAGDEGLVLAHAISLWPDDLVQLLHCSVGHHFLEEGKGEKGIYWIFQNLIRPRPQLPALHLWDSAPDLRGLEYQMLLWPMLEAAVALVHTLKSKFSVKVALASTLMGTQERGSYIKVDKWYKIQFIYTLNIHSPSIVFYFSFSWLLCKQLITSPYIPLTTDHFLS